MVKSLFLICSLSCAFAFAKDLTPQEIRDRLEVRADIYTFDSTGKKILSGPAITYQWRTNADTGTIKGDFSTNLGSDDKTLAFRQLWEVTNDGHIKVTLEEYAEIVGEAANPDFKKLLEHKDFVVQNFEPFVWIIKNSKNHYVLRFFPYLRELSDPVAISDLPVSGKDLIVTDSDGYLWLDGGQMSGRFAGLTSHRGTVVMSYSSFKGAKPMGTAEGSLISLKPNKDYTINVKSSSAFLPAGMSAKVYGLYLPNRRSNGLNSVRTFTSSKEKNILDALER